MEQPNRNYLSSFGRNRGRSLRPHQQSLVDGLLPKISIDPNAPSFSRLSRESIFGEMDPRDKPEDDAVGAYKHIALEIGFGGGEHLLAQAAHHPDTLFIGCEPFLNGVARCLSALDVQKPTNVRLFMDDARKLIEALPDACVDSVFILFPDPWPKVRHNKRRLVNAKTLAMLARIHKPGGRLLLATDHVDYSVWMLEVLAENPHYKWTAREQGDWKTPPADWTVTKYQRKTTAQGRDPVFLECVRTAA